MAREDVIAFIIVGLVVILILIVIIGYYISNHKTSPVSEPTTATGSFLSSCINSSCATGLSCDGNTFVCKIDTGLPCNNNSDCLVGVFCSGICTTGAIGGLNELCPCLPGLTCIATSGSVSLCKTDAGGTCSNDGDCASTFCIDNICTIGAPPAYPCTNDNDCNSGNCSNGFCQAPGISTGIIGAACAGQCLSVTGAGCNEGLACQCNATGGVCITPTQGILSACSIYSPCTDTMFCANGTGQECTATGTGCICVYPYDNPNVIEADQICIVNMTGTSTCLNETGQGCSTNGMCSSNLCNANNPILTSFVFDIGGLTITPNAHLAALLPGASLPYKMFGVSNGTTDTIYIVDHIRGLVSVTYDPITNTTGAVTIAIPYTYTFPDGSDTVTNTLIDTSFNGVNYIVAFHQSSTSGQEADVVYLGFVPEITGLVPYNVTTGLPGSQYDTAGNPMLIDYIDYSTVNDVQFSGNDVLIVQNGTVYIQSEGVTTTFAIATVSGGPMNGLSITGTTGPVRFYYDIEEGGTGTAVCPGDGTSAPIQCPSVNNIAFSNNYIDHTGSTQELILNYSGNIAGYTTPNDRFGNVNYRVYDFSIYSPPGVGMINSKIISLTQIYDNTTLIGNAIVLTVNGNSTPIPYQIDNGTISYASVNAFYTLNIGACN